MSDYMTLLFALLSGAVLGLFFFFGLWWTVQKLSETKHVAIWFMSSFLIRTLVVVMGFYFILGDSWQRLLAGLLGFIIARMLVIKITRVVKKANVLTETIDHAP